jgi:hypothetical protein
MTMFSEHKIVANGHPKNPIPTQLETVTIRGLSNEH